MVVCVVNLAEDRRGQSGARCQVLRCRNAGRWILALDCGAEVFVCRLHANQGERTGRLTLAAPLPRQLEICTPEHE